MTRNPSKLSRLCALLAALVLLLAAAPQALSAGRTELLVGVVSTITTEIKPLNPKERDIISVYSLVYESLVTIDDSYQPQPMLAESWTTQTGSTWTFTLRENVFFHDGTRLMASDVAATIQEILRMAKDETAGADTGLYSNLQYFVTDVEVKDDRTLVIKTGSRAYYGFPYEMTFPILKASEVSAANPSGTGPYRIVNFEPADMLWMTANDLWWKPTPAIKDVVAVLYPTQRSLISGFEYGNVDTVITRATAAAQYRTGVGTLNLTYRTNQLETLLLNHSAFPLEDIRVRQAIRYAIDIDKLVSSCYMGMAERTDTPIAKSLWMYGVDDNAVAYSPDTARQLLSEAGWEDSGDDGTRDKTTDDGEKHLVLRLYVYEEADNSVRIPAANTIAEMLGAVGIQVNVRTMSFADAKKRLMNGNYDMCLAAYQMDVSPDAGFILMSSNTGNYTRYRSEDITELCKTVRKSLDMGAYQSAQAAVQQKFIEDCPFICLYYRTGSLLTRELFTSVRDIRDGEALRGVEEWIP